MISEMNEDFLVQGHMNVKYAFRSDISMSQIAKNAPSRDVEEYPSETSRIRIRMRMTSEILISFSMSTDTFVVVKFSRRTVQ